MKGVIKLLRPPLVVLSIVAPISLMLHYTHKINIPLVLAILFGNISLTVTNDILDIESDKIMKPHKPLPSGEVSLKTAKKIVLISMPLSLIFLLLTKDATTIKLGELALFCGMLYNIRKDIGNIFLASCYGLTAYICSHNIQFSLAFALLTLAYNVSVQIQDVFGDLVANIRTLPTTIGVRKSKIVTYITSILCIFMFNNPLFILSAIFVVLSETTGKRETFCRKLSRLMMILGFVSMVIA